MSNFYPSLSSHVMERKKKSCVEFMWSPEYQMTILRTCLHVASNLKVTPRLLNFFRICSDARIFQDLISLSMVYLFRCGQILCECEKKRYYCLPISARRTKVIVISDSLVILSILCLMKSKIVINNELRFFSILGLFVEIIHISYLEDF